MNASNAAEIPTAGTAVGQNAEPTCEFVGRGQLKVGRRRAGVDLGYAVELPSPRHRRRDRSRDRARGAGAGEPAERDRRRRHDQCRPKPSPPRPRTRCHADSSPTGSTHPATESNSAPREKTRFERNLKIVHQHWCFVRVELWMVDRGSLCGACDWK